MHPPSCCPLSRVGTLIPGRTAPGGDRRPEGGGLVRERLQQLVEGLGERRDPLVLEDGGDVVHVDPGAGQPRERGRRSAWLGIDGPCERAVVLERLERAARASC